jgi:FAD:protein FMN transferase
VTAPTVVRAPVMGTGVTFRVHGDDRRAATAGIDEALRWLRWVDDTFSTYRSDSEISRLATGTITLQDCSSEVAEVLELCTSMRDRTDGYFDAHYAERLDPSGIVKGWAVERASAMLARAGLTTHMIECGGDVRVRGGPHPHGAWKVGITHPNLADRLCAVLELDAGAIATSGSYERGLHVIDPHTGRAPHEIISLTVIGASLTEADGLATAALAMGASAPEWLSHQSGAEAMVIDIQGRAWRSDGFHQYEYKGH